MPMQRSLRVCHLSWEHPIRLSIYLLCGNWQRRRTSLSPARTSRRGRHLSSLALHLSSVPVVWDSRVGSLPISSATATVWCSMSRRTSVPRRSRSSQPWRPSSNQMSSQTSMVTETMRTTNTIIRCASTITRRVTTTRRAGTISTSSAGWVIRCR